MPAASGVHADPTAPPTRSRKLIAHPTGHDATLAQLLATAGISLGGSTRRRGRERGVTMLTKDAVERILLEQLRQAGAPEPTHGPDTNGWRFRRGRRWRIDFAWTDLVTTDHLLIPALEVEGGSYPIRQKDGSLHVGRHLSPEGYQNDCIKYSEAILDGVLLLRVTTAMVCDQQGRPDGRALALILRALEKTKPAALTAGALSYSVPVSHIA